MEMENDRSLLYLDSNATTRPLPEVMDAMTRVMAEVWANPSSIHRAGQLARREVDAAREEVASLLNARPDEIIFTSGGTESVNTSLSSLARSRSQPLLVTSAVEHAAVREAMEDLAAPTSRELLVLEHDRDGRIDMEAFDDLLAQRHEDIAFVSVMWANNETGVVQPIEGIGARCGDHGIPFHTDATQWVGKMPVDVQTLPVDMLSFAGHKFHGPKGTGVLWLRQGQALHPMVRGGGQERRRRGGTESVPGITGLGVACRAAREWLEAEGYRAMEQLRDRFEECLREAVPSACTNAASAERIWSTSNIGFPGVEPELMLLGLSEAGVCASAGSACSSGALKSSTVIDAIGRQPCQTENEAYGSVRFSFDRTLDEETIDRAVAVIRDVFHRLHDIAPQAAWPLTTSETESGSRL